MGKPKKSFHHFKNPKNLEKITRIFFNQRRKKLKTPFNFGGPQQEFKPWVATLFIGGGFSKLYNKVRINLGIFYDVINANNSPFRPNYAIKINDPEGNVQRILPIIYRINFFFPLGNKSKEDK